MICLVGCIYAGPVQFSGSASAYSELYDMEGAVQLRPNSTLRFRVNPTLNIYGMPLSLDLFISSEESGIRQALNKFRIFLQPSRLLRDMVNAPGFVFSISGIEIGTCSPQFTPLTLGGTAVTGGAFEMNPWILYMAGAGGRIQRGVEASDSTVAAYERTLYAGRFGFGKKQGTHLYFTFLYAGDDTTSINPYTLPLPGDSDTVDVLVPQENYVGGVELQLSFGENVTILSEVTASQHTRDTRMPELVLPEAPDWALDFFNPRMSSSFDFALAVKPVITLQSTRVWGGWKMIGPGYRTFGVPRLRNDILAIEAGIQQGLFNNGLSVSASYKNEHDNVIDSKASTTYFSSYAFVVGLNFLNIPYVQAMYSPIRQSNETLNIQNNDDVLSFSTGYNFQLGGLYHSPAVSWQHQKHTELTSQNDYTSNTVSFTENASFSIPLNITAGIGVTNADHDTTETRILTMDFGVSYTLFSRWTNTVGYGRTTDRERGNRHAIRFNSSIPLWWLGNANLLLERNIFRGEQDDDYNEWRFVSTLSKNW
jgi:hypothetical protein